MARIYPSSYPSVPIKDQSIFTHLFEDTSRGNYDTGVYVDAPTGTTLTVGRLKELSLAFGYGISNHPGLAVKLRRGDTVCYYSANSMTFSTVLLGSIAAGLRFTPANSAYTPRELKFQFKDSGAQVVITQKAGVATVKTMLKELGIPSEGRIIIIDGDEKLDWVSKAPGTSRRDVVEVDETHSLPHFEDLLGMGQLKSEEKFDGERANETAVLCYSSGTTGNPKGVETTHRNLTSMCDMGLSVFPSLPQTGLAFLPQYHVYGLVNLTLLPLHFRMKTVYLPRFDPIAFLETIQKYKVTLCMLVPPVLLFLAKHPVVAKYDLSSLRVLISAAAPLGPELEEAVYSRLLAQSKTKAECAIYQGYGLTETSPGITIVPASEALSARKTKAGSVGVLMSNMELRLVNEAVDENGKEVEVDANEGERGEVWVRGANVMKGYLNNPTATKNSITPDGWFKTGDVAIRDKEGWYWIVDRKKELIKYKGFQVPPAELEALLLTHPDVADVAVIGVDSPNEATEVPKAYISVNPSAQPKLQAKSDVVAFTTSIQKWVEERVAKHKYLRGGVEIIEVVPKSAAGKILRRELREKAKLDLQAKAKL